MTKLVDELSQTNAALNGALLTQHTVHTCRKGLTIDHSGSPRQSTFPGRPGPRTHQSRAHSDPHSFHPSFSDRGEPSFARRIRPIRRDTCMLISADPEGRTFRPWPRRRLLRVLLPGGLSLDLSDWRESRDHRNCRNANEPRTCRVDKIPTCRCRARSLRAMRRTPLFRDFPWSRWRARVHRSWKNLEGTHLLCEIVSSQSRDGTKEDGRSHNKYV